MAYQATLTGSPTPTSRQCDEHDHYEHVDAVRNAAAADSDRHSVATFGVRPNAAPGTRTPPQSSGLVSGTKVRRAQSPVAPSMASRSRSAWPLWRAYSSIMCSKTQRTLVSR